MRWRLDFLHPSTGRLRAWLETGEPEGVGEHVEHCERCADRLEQLDSVDELDAADPAPLRQALAAALNPPDDLNERLLQGVANRNRAGEDLQLFAGLFSIGFETARLMIDTDVHQDRHDPTQGSNGQDDQNGTGRHHADGRATDEEDDPT